MFLVRLRRIHNVRGLIIALAFLLTSSACSTEAQKKRHLERGEEYFGEEQYQEAIIEFLNVIQLDENDRVANQRLGLALYNTGQLGPAFRYLQRAAELNPNDTEVRVRLATIYRYSGQIEEAREEAGAVLQDDPKNLDALTVFADTASSPGEIEGAMRRLENARSEHEADARFHLARGVLFIRQQEMDEAEAAFQEAADREPESPAGHLALGTFYLVTNDFTKAATEFDQAAEIAPTRSGTQIRVVDFYRLLGRADDANARLDALVAEAPDFLPAWQRIAGYSFADGDYERSKEALEHVLETTPRNPEALRLLAEVYRETGDRKAADEKFRETISVLQDFVQRRPEQASAHFRLAQMHMRVGEIEQARTSLDTVIEIAPNSPSASILLAELNIRTGRASLAIAPLQDLAQRQPTAITNKLLGQAFLAEKDFEQAVDAFREYVALAPTEAEAYHDLGTSLTALNQTEEAIKQFREALSLDPTYVEPLAMLATLDARQQRLGRAIETVQSQMDQIEPTGRHHFLLGQLYRASNDLDQAEQSFTTAVELQPDLNAAYAQLAAIYSSTNREEEAIAALERGLEHDPENVPVMMLKGMVQHQTANIGAAQSTYEELLGVNPRFAPAANNLAYIYQEQEGMLEKALELAEMARAEAPDNPDIADTLGWILYKRGTYERALGLVKEAAAARPDNAEIHFHVGFVHYRLGEFQDTAEAFSRALELDPNFPLAEEAQTILLELR